jgi:integrase
MYRKARLVAPSDLDCSKDWYIIFYTTDAFNQKLIRKRVLKEEFASLPDPEQRLSYSKQAIAEINLMLFNDWHTESARDEPIVKFDFKNYSLIQAMDYVTAVKRDVEELRAKTIKEYSATKSTLKDFMLHEQINQDYLLRNIKDTFLRKYFDYLKQVRKSSNKTYNARRSVLHSSLAVLIKRDPKLFNGSNPVEEIKTLKTETKKHAAYSDDQMVKIREAIIKGNESHLLFFIQFMYFTLSRPEEIRQLRISDIHFQDKKILYRAEISKTVIEQYVGINETFAGILEESNVLKYPGSYYVFSNNGGKHCPGQRPVSNSYFYKHIKQYINALGYRKLNSNYTLYSFKHTGAVALYKATKDIKLVQAQCRHQSIEQTNVYLRDLGVLSDFDQLNKWKGPF